MRYLFGDVQSVYGRVDQWGDRMVFKEQDLIKDDREDTRGCIEFC